MRLATLITLTAAVLLLGHVGAARAALTFKGTGSGALQHGVGGKVDITDPDNNNTVDAGEWSISANPNTVGDFSTSGNNGEKWSKVFDNAVNGTGPWGSNTSKVCCNFTNTPPGTFVQMNSATHNYVITGYTIANGNDSSPGRDPTAWTFEGSTNGGGSWTVLDTVAGFAWGGTNRVYEQDTVAGGGPYNAFRFVFTASGGGFHLSEVEVFGYDPLVHVGGDNTIGMLTLNGTQQNEVYSAAMGRFVRVSKVNADIVTKMHISEIEAFGLGVTPDELGPASANGNPSLSTNDLMFSGVHLATTTQAVEHGGEDGFTRPINGLQEGGGNVYSTASGLASPDPRYTADLGSTLGIGTVRVYPRNDGCCQDRFRNLRVELLADDGMGNPGAVVASFDGPTTDTAAMLQGSFAELVSAELFAQLNNVVTYSFEIDANTGMADQIKIDNPNPNVFTTILDVNGASFEFEVLGDINQLPFGSVFQVLAVDQIEGFAGAIDAPIFLDSNRAIDTSRLLIDGTVSIGVAVPEPATLGLLGLAGLALLRRRRAA